MSKAIGSDDYGTSVMRTDECELMAQTMLANGSAPEQAALELEALDDMLSVMRMRAVVHSQRLTAKGRVRKDATIQHMISSRLDHLLEDLKNMSHV